MVGPGPKPTTPGSDIRVGEIQGGDKRGGDQTVAVSLGDRSYDIRIRCGTDTTASAIVEVTDPTHVIVFFDAAVSTLAEKIVAGLNRCDVKRVDAMPIASGETSKSLSQYGDMLQFCLDRGGDRRSVIVAVGGGVVGDLAGFVAATYTRGVRFVQVPTTLLSMVDSSVGGKTGINLPGGKNMVGSFWQPELVNIETPCLDTLPQRDFVSGIAEVLKYGVIDDAEFFAWLEDNMASLVARDAATIASAVAWSCRCKASVVAEDERETSGRRAILNYGHTFAHAIEATTGYGTVTHGQAVAIGMEMAMQLATALSMIDPSCQTRQRDLISAAGLPLRASEIGVKLDPDAICGAMSKDKKVAHGQLRFILPTKIGHVDLVGDIETAAVKDAIISIEQPPR